MKKIKRALSLVLVFCMLCTMTVTGFAADTTSGGQTDFMKVVHLDAGRKYFSVDSIKKIIDNASADGYNYLELGVGNDGLRFLLDDMSVTANDKTYSSEAVSEAIHAGNEAYYNFNTDELTQSEMDGIISYAKNKGISIIPLINSPGHMDAILSAANSLTGTTCSYDGSKRTIDVTNDTAVAFTQALIQKYVNYFAGKDCKYFNMGADEYANDVYTGGSMGFGNLQDTGKYSYFVKYVNQMAAMIKNAGMTPMAFNDGIYYNNVTSDDTFDTGILVSYWSSGWSGYTPASASFLASQGFKLLNTHGSYYWVLGKSDAQCSAEKASGFNYKAFQGGTIDNPVGAMFCIWCDYPGADTEANVVSQTADTMAAFAETLPSTSNSGTTTPNKAPAAPTSKIITVPVGGTVTETVSGDYSNSGIKAENENIAKVKAKYTKTDASSISYNASASVSEGNGYTDGYIDGSKTYPSKNIIDNNANTFCWYPDAQPVGTYMQVDLGAAIPFGAVRLTTPSRAGADVCTNAAVKVSADRSTWETIGSYTGEEGKSQIFTNTVDTVRYIRVELTTAKNTWWKLAEIEWGNVDASNNFTRMAASGTVTQEASEQTTLTFTGVAAGTTTVQVGDATYTVHVVDKAPAANTIRLEYWITNSKVYSQNNTNSDYYTAITTNTNGVRTETGVDVSTLAPEHAYSEFGGWKDVYYWQTMRLDANNKQTNDSGDDETADGTTLTHIRYWNNAWQYQTSDGTWNSFESGDQLVAYYLQKTDVTQEITTYAKDWGYATSGKTPDTSDKEGQVALTVAVVYPDGTVSPAESDMYSQSTTIFNYWYNRDIGIVAPINNSDYDISKITVTDGTRDDNKNENVWYNENIWYSSDSITWKKTTNDAGSEWYDEKTVWDETTNAGTTPMVNGKTSNITWSAKNTAKLVLIYLKPVQKKTNLNVVYWDDNENKAINANPFQIAMKYNQGDEQPSFVTRLRQSSEVKTGTFTLDDDAYVTNSSGVNQTFNKDLSIVQGRHTDEIDPKYGSGLYEYASADISEDGKTLTLHYNLKPNALTKNYIVDFGESVDVPITDLINKTESVTKVEVSPNAKVNADNSITYTPSKILTGTDFVKVTVTYSTGSTQPFTIGFTPASNVMYEESFVKPEGTEWKTTEDAENDTQATEVLGEEDIHGYDESYETDSEFSNDSAYQAQLTIPSGKDFTETKKATFTFTGTGFDVISECGTNTGVLLAVVKDTDGKTVKSYLVDTYFTGDEKGIISGTDILDYQVPVVRCMGLTQATYTVDVYGYLTNGSGAVKNAAKSAEATTAEGEVSEETVAEVLDDMSVKGVKASEVEATCMDDNSVLLGGTGVEETAAKSRTARAAVATSANVYIDGVRVYNTLNENNGANKYTKSEQNVKYESVYDYVKNSLDANGSWTEKAMIYTEYDGSTDISSIAEYKQQGPENEVYLAPGCDIAFALKNYKEGDTAQIAMKAVKDSVTVDSEQCETSLLESATEMYYKLTPKYDEELGVYVVKIGNDEESDGVLSLSNLKLSSDVTVSSNQALADKIIEEDNTKPAFTPKTFTVSVPAETLKVGRSSVIKVKASTDVAHVYMKVDDEKPIELNANNRNAVANGKTDLYSYSKTIKTKGKEALSKGGHKYSIYAVDEGGNQSKAVDFTVTIAE